MENVTSINHRDVFHDVFLFVCSSYATVTYSHEMVVGRRQKCI